MTFALLLAAANDRDLVRLVLVLVIALILAALVFWVISYFGVPQPLAALAAILVFLLVFFGAGGFD